MRDLFDRYTALFYILIVALIWGAIYSELYVGKPIVAIQHKPIPTFDIDALSEHHYADTIVDQPWDKDFKSVVIPVEEK